MIQKVRGGQVGHGRSHTAHTVTHMRARSPELPITDVDCTHNRSLEHVVGNVSANAISASADTRVLMDGGSRELVAVTN
jgi:hypothetical protein